MAKIAIERRRKVWRRDHWQCHYCQRTVEPPNGWVCHHLTATADHKVAIADGGTDEQSNLLTACWQCNNNKGHMKYEDFMKLPVESRIAITPLAALKRGYRY